MSVTRDHDHSYFAVGFVRGEPREAVCLDCGLRVPAAEIINSALVPDHRLCGILLAQRCAAINGRAHRIGRIQSLVIGGMPLFDAVALVRREAR